MTNTTPEYIMLPDGRVGQYTSLGQKRNGMVRYVIGPVIKYSWFQEEVIAVMNIYDAMKRSISEKRYKEAILNG